MEKALIYGLTASSALVLGSIIGTRWKVPKRVLAVLLAFAGGALIAALSFELFDVSFDKGGAVRSGLGLLAGAAVFIGIDYFLVERLRGKATGWALLTAATLDGIPENLALGTTLASGRGSVALLVAIFVANVPEALVGASKMRSLNHSVPKTLLVWGVTSAVLVFAVIGGTLGLQESDSANISLILAFAAGAVLAAVADAMLPEAYRDAGPLVAFSTVSGFFISFILNTV